MALYLGDPTARDLNRLTLNPVPHIDPFGSVVLPALLVVTQSPFFIAWAKPVPVNPENFTHPRRDNVLVSVVGPVSNFLLACICTIITICLILISPLVQNGGTYAVAGMTFLLLMFKGGVSINIFLGILNLIPVPPLDGSHILSAILPEGLREQYRRVGFFGMIFLLLLLNWEPSAQVLYGIIRAANYPFAFIINHFDGLAR